MTAGLDMRAELEERRLQALRDLAELRRQVATGEIDAESAAELEETYEADAAVAIEALESLDESAAAVAQDRPAGGRRPSRRAAGVALVVLAAALIAALLPRYLSPRADQAAAGGGGVGGLTVDPASVSNEQLEQVVAANPDIVPMRLALARRYMEAQDYRKALQHYQVILQREKNPEAMANVGWILFSTGQHADAAEKLELESLQRAPGDPLAMWYLANIRLYGRNDPQGAAQVARQLLQQPISDEDRRHVEDLLAEAERRAGPGPAGGRAR